MKSRGFTLIEMLAVITVSSAVMGMGIVMLVALLKNEGSSRRHLEFCNNLNRLDDRFRTDIHTASSASLGEEGKLLELVLSTPEKTTIRYHYQPQEITREECQGDKIIHTESYSIPEEVSVLFEQKTDEGVSSLSIQFAPKPTSAPKIHYPSTRIETILARDLRFRQPEEKK